MRHAPRHQILNGYLVQITEDLTSDLFPERLRRIVRAPPSREHAIIVLVSSHRMLNRRHNLGDFDLCRLYREQVTATRPPHTLYEPGFAELSEHLF